MADIVSKVWGFCNTLCYAIFPPMQSVTIPPGQNLFHWGCALYFYKRFFQKAPPTHKEGGAFLFLFTALLENSVEKCDLGPDLIW